MDNISKAYAFYKMTNQQRQLSADQLIKSTAPNKEELHASDVDFRGVLRDLSKREEAELKEIKKVIDRNTEHKQGIDKTTKQASLNLSEAYQMTTLFKRLLEHNVNQSRVVVDSFRPQ